MENKTVLAGNLTFLTLGDLLQLLGTDNRTGVLRIINPHFKDPGLIYIKSGNPVDAQTSDKTGVDAIYALFGWVSGKFEFNSEEVKHQDVIKKRMMAIVLDALRVLDEGGIETFGDASAKESGQDIKSAPAITTAIKGPFVEYSSVVDEDEYTDGATIVAQGRHGNWLWVILEGIVDIFKQTEHGQALVSSSGTGAFIGGLTTILQPENSRSASAVARGTVQLGVIDTQQLSSEMSTIDPEFKKVLLSLDNRFRKISSRYTDILNGHNKFDGLPLNIKPMIRQGDDVQKVFTILNGEAHIVRKSKNGMIYLMTLGKGDFIGRVPFLNIDHEPSFASVFASEDLKLGILDTEKLIEEYTKLSVTIKNIIEYTTVCLSATTSRACA
ncbi:MAG: cyclic nucleotide-binding domain-containing protein [Proteobacteria bacterium]|nr:cyclic nucleotide-binding domain-containing protein [Pseudomonadota bacterium]